MQTYTVTLKIILLKVVVLGVFEAKEARISNIPVGSYLKFIFIFRGTFQCVIINAMILPDFSTS